MSRKTLLSALVLWPISRIYGMIMSVRNFLFDKGVLKQHVFDIPVVVVGNIAVGGTGKTPHTEYLVEQLSADYRIAVLSRGYKRRTKGYLVASTKTTPDEIGDEPAQIYRRFGGRIPVVVCEDRVKGIKGIRRQFPEVNMVILDDAFQHRYVKPSAAVVLVEYGKPPYRDAMLPLGRLREPITALNRADIVVVTKCPASAKPMDFRVYKETLNLYPYQRLYFSRYEYLKPVPLFPSAAITAPDLGKMKKDDVIISVTGVANPLPFVRKLRRSGARVKVATFDDHHHFDASDLQLIRNKFENAGSSRRYILTTEKDAIRLAKCADFPDELKPYIFYIPIHVEMLSAMAPVSLPDAVRQCVRSVLNK